MNDTSDPISHRNNYEGYIKNMTEHQRELHGYKDSLDIMDDEIENYESDFSLKKEQTTWSYRFSENMKLASTQDAMNAVVGSTADRTFTFLLNNDVHAIHQALIKQPLPNIIFQEGYEGCWTPDILIVILKSGTFYQGQKIIGSMDTIYNLQQIDTVNNAEKQIIRENIGNIDMLQKPNSVLPNFTLRYLPPWTFNGRGENYPVLLTSNSDVIKLEITMVRNIEKLLIVRNKLTGERVTKLDEKCIKKIDGFDWSSTSSTLSSPSVVGYYAYMDKRECYALRNKVPSPDDQYKYISSGHSVNGDINIPKQVPLSFTITDRKIASSSDNIKLGETVVVDLIFTEPVAPFMLQWFVQNQTSVKNNNYTNGSTNSDDSSSGYNTFGEVSIQMNGKDVVPFTDGESFRALGCHPTRLITLNKGSGIYTTSIYDEGIRSGNPVKKLTLHIQLKNMNPYIGLIENSSNLICNDSFKVYFMATYYRKLTFYEYPKDDEERENGKPSKILIS